MSCKVKILADSTCDLPAQILFQYHVDTVPLYVTLGEDTFKDDGLAITPADMYDFVQKTGKLPKTAATSMNDFIEFFRPYVEEGYDVIYIALSGELSVTYQNAVNAAEEFGGKVTAIDSRSLSTGIGLLVLHAAEMAQAGASAAEIKASLDKKIPLVRASFLVDTLDYLHKGGRCSTLQMLGAAMLKFKPMLQLRDGKIVNTGKMRGSIGKALRQYVKHVIDEGPVDPRRVFVTHSPMPGGEAQDILAMVKELGIFDEVIETNAGSVVGSHCGPGTLGVLFFAREEQE